MQRLLPTAAVAMCAGCGFLTGLDQLIVDGGSSDATNEVDDSDATDARPDDAPNVGTVDAFKESGTPSCIDSGILCPSTTVCCTKATFNYGKCVPEASCP